MPASQPLHPTRPTRTMHKAELFFLRFLAGVADLAVMFAVLLIIFVIYLIFTGDFDMQAFKDKDPIGQAYATLWIEFLVVAYFVLMESSPKQASVGKMAFQLKVVNAEGGRVKVATTLKRVLLLMELDTALILLYSLVADTMPDWVEYVLASIFFLILLPILFTKGYQGLHDKLGNTYVMATNRVVKGQEFLWENHGKHHQGKWKKTTWFKALWHSKPIRFRINRVLAAFADIILTLVVFTLLRFLLFSLYSFWVADAESYHFGQNSAATAFKNHYMVCFLFFHWAYFTGIESRFAQASPGKLLFGLKVVTTGGKQPELWQVGLRYFLFLAPIILPFFSYMFGWKFSYESRFIILSYFAILCMMTLLTREGWHESLTGTKTIVDVPKKILQKHPHLHHDIMEEKVQQHLQSRRAKTSAFRSPGSLHNRFHRKDNLG